MSTYTPTYCVLTWGCQMNEEDSEQLGLFLEQDGFLPATDAESADVVLLNTCSVRRKPEEKVFSKLGELRLLKVERPTMVIGVCGCMAQVQADEIQRRAPYVDIIAGTGHIADIPALVREAWRRRNGTARHQAVTELSLPERKGNIVVEVPERTFARPRRLRAFVPVMYGCDRFCTFCIVPSTRGRERSRPPSDILNEIRRLAYTGTREVTLLGQTVNYYGRHLPPSTSGESVTLAGLIREIAQVPGIERIRFTSPHPCGFTDELIRVIADCDRVCEHVHLPLQAADDHLLRRMRRGYTVDRYRRLLDKLRKHVPGIAVTTDIMLGFPGETREQYRATLEFVREARFDSAFMFAYSPRPGTRAAASGDQVPEAEKVDRLNELIATQNGITAEINRSSIGSSVDVLVDGASERNANRAVGLTRTFKTVHIDPVPGDSPGGTGSHEPKLPKIGDTVRVVVTDAGLTGLIADWAPDTGDASLIY